LQHPSDPIGTRWVRRRRLRLEDGHRIAVERAQLGLIPPSQRRSQPAAEPKASATGRPGGNGSAGIALVYTRAAAHG
jgi:hypothetical protein